MVKTSCDKHMVEHKGKSIMPQFNSKCDVDVFRLVLQFYCNARCFLFTYM